MSLVFFCEVHSRRRQGTSKELRRSSYDGLSESDVVTEGIINEQKKTRSAEKVPECERNQPKTQVGRLGSASLYFDIELGTDC